MRKRKLAPIHPGEHLADILKESGITANALALRLRVPANRITLILQGKRAITPRPPCAWGGILGPHPSSG